MAFLTKFVLNSGFSATQITLLLQDVSFNASPVHNIGGVLFALKFAQPEHFRFKNWLHDNSSVFGQIETSLNWQMNFEDNDLHQIQEDWAGRNFMTISHANSLLIIKECRDESQIYNYHGFNCRFMN